MMVTANTQPVCYLVSPLPYGTLPGQENEEAREFARTIIIPALKAEGFTVLTAEEGFRNFAGQQRNPGAAVASSQQWLERSDLVIVDMTQEAENCVFEIGYRNALRKPCIVYTAGRNATTGDIAGVRYLTRPSRDISTNTKIEHLREQIRQVMTGVSPAVSELDQPNFGFASDSAPFGSGTFANSSGGAIQTQNLGIPASDRLVTLSHNSAEYQEATGQLNKLIEAVEFDRTNDFEEKEQLLAELRAGRELLKSTKVSPSRVEVILYGCLGYIAAKFADEPIGALAHLTWSAIKTLLGH